MSAKATKSPKEQNIKISTAKILKSDNFLLILIPKDGKGHKEREAGFAASFGILKGKIKDSVAYQRKLRDEWDDRI